MRGSYPPTRRVPAGSLGPERAYPGRVMTTKRPCSRVTCQEPAVATLTYVYADSMAVLGPLSLKAEPHSYDLCAGHADRLSVPLGWSVMRITAPDDGPAAEPERSKGTLFGL
ncbi:MAG: hypothetical protein QOJ68_269 [Blastococcus sp.]|nr:hypothetical protein [Blastococcus sp.]